MTESTASAALESGMQNQALAWIARLRADSVSEQDRQEFALWLAARPEHRAAMDAMLELWEDLAVVKHLPLAPAEPASSRRRWIGSGLALAASICLALLLSPQLLLDYEHQEFRTQTGEQLAIELSDGSSIKLNTNSALRVDMDRQQRRFSLTRGEAFFEVARDPERPFIVAAGNTEVRALGTAFNVLLQRGLSEITVTEGVVRVTELNAPASRAADTALLYENQKIAGDRRGLASPTQVDSEHSLAWRDGKLVAEEMPLAELVAELSRYHERKILIAEPGLAQKTVSGVFQLEDPDSILLALEHTVGIRSVELEDGSVQLIRAPL
ncbi:MAG: FecR family protein [Halieaceae bacterium]